MVSIAVLLFTVSTLAAQINGIPTQDLANHDRCQGKTHCFEKPADYPQEAIELLARSNLAQLHRMKRHILNTVNFNDCVESSEEVPLFKVEAGGKSLNVIQTSLYEQKVPKVICKTKTPCSSSIDQNKEKNAKIEFSCQPMKTKISLLTADEEGRNPKRLETELTTGCYCAKKE